MDLSPRVGGDTTNMLLARQMATEVGLKHSAMFSGNNHQITAQEQVAKANDINSNNKDQGMVVILSVADDDNGCYLSDVSVFAKTSDQVQSLFQKLVNN